MPKTSNRELILTTSLHLFNRDGVAITSTNHIATAAGVSPGNFYYHFSDKEEILRILFADMALKLEKMWKEVQDPESFFHKTLEIVWKYRFFHREMYPIRRVDVQLNRLWRKHIIAAQSLLALQLRSWRPDDTETEITDLGFAILAFISASTHIFESSLRPTRSQHIEFAFKQLMRMIR